MNSGSNLRLGFPIWTPSCGASYYAPFRVHENGVTPKLGLYDYGARWYDPELGRFLQPDTVVPEPSDPQSLNRYSYVRNNPISRIDATGHQDRSWNLGSVVPSPIRKLEAAVQRIGEAALNGGTTGARDQAIREAAEAINSSVPTLGEGPKVDAEDLVDAAHAADAVSEAVGGATESRDAISMDEAVDRGARHVGGEGDMESTKGGNFQFRNTQTDEAGDQASDMARFDVNPDSGHVQRDGPHLNLETHLTVDGKTEKTNEHIPIDPSTVRSGDYPKRDVGTESGGKSGGGRGAGGGAGVSRVPGGFVGHGKRSDGF